MFKFLIFSFLLFNIDVSDAGEVDVSKISAVLHSIGSGIVRENLVIAKIFRNIDKSTLTNILRTIVPSLNNAGEALVKIGKYFQLFKDTLAHSSSTNSNNVYVSDSILNANYAPIDALRTHFQNIIASNLKMEVFLQQRNLTFESGYAVINTDLANTIVSTLNYVADQFDELGNVGINWKVALNALSKALANNSGNRRGAYIFKELAKAVAHIAHCDVLLAHSYRHLAQAYVKINQSNSSGSRLLLPPQILAQVTNHAAQQMSNAFNRIAVIFGRFESQLIRSDNSS